MNDLREVEVKVYEASSCYDIPTDAVRFMAFFQDKLDKIPEHLIGSARIEIDAEERSGSAYLAVKVSYRRPETEEEALHRQIISARRAKMDRLLKFSQLDELRRELGV